jgi:hypothetical protein
MAGKALKYGLIIGGGGLAAYALTKAAGFKDAAEKLSLNITRFDVSNKGLEYLKFILDLEFVNPSNETITIEIQSIKPVYNGSEIGYSVPVKDKTEITPKSISKISGIEIRTPITNLISIGILKDAIQLATNPSSAIDKLKKNIVFRVVTRINGIEVKIEQGFGEEAQELGLVAAGKRKIKDGKEYNFLFPAPKGTSKRVQNNADVMDTVKWCGVVVKTYYNDTEKLAKYLNDKSSTKKELFKNIFDFCYNHIQYHLDRPGVEELRRPAQTWKDRGHGVDCDDFTMFIATILYNLKIPFEFRITKYFKPNYQHIYLIVPVANGTHVTIDPVLDTFNYEKPFSEKKDFDMKSLNLAGAQAGMGIPIEILGAATNGAKDFSEDFIKVITGEDLKPTMNGLGSTEDDSAAMLRYLKRLRNLYVTNPEYIKDFQAPHQAVEMLDYAIKYWDTPKREAAIERLTIIEDGLIAKGEIKLSGFDDFEDDDEDWEDDVTFSGIEPELAGYEYKYYHADNDWEEDIDFSGAKPELAGFEYRYEEPEWEEDFEFSGKEPELAGYTYDYSFDGLAGKRRRRRKARRAVRRTKRKARKTARRARRRTKGGLFRRVGKGIKKGFKKVAKGVVKVGAAPMRLAFLAALRANAGGISEKLKYAYLSQQQAIARGIDLTGYNKLKQAHSKVENMFIKMGGNRTSLKKAILSGKRKNLRGFENIGGTIAGIGSMDGFELDSPYTGKEAESPDYEYKYDNQIWEVDDNFSGSEYEDPQYDYDYSFNGLDGRFLRFRKSRSPKKRFRRKKLRLIESFKNPQFQKLLKAVAADLNQEGLKNILEKKQAKQAFLTALANNYQNISTLLAIGLKHQEEAESEGVPLEDWKKIQTAYTNALQLFKSITGGNEKEFKKAIEIGENKHNLEGLGSVIAAGGAAAGLIGKIVGWLKNIKIKRKARKEAKTSYTASGKTNKQWKQQGKQNFNTAWANQKQAQKATAQQQSTKVDFNDIIKNNLLKSQVQQAAPQGTATTKATAQAASPLPVPAGQGENNDPTDSDGIKGFLQNHKKKLLIGGGVLAVGTVGYILYKKHQENQLPVPKPGKAQNNLSGTKRKKSPAKVKATKLSVVKLS